MTDLPTGWERVSLGDLLLRIETGKSFLCEPRPASEDEWGVVKVSAMTWGTFLEDENKAIPPGRSFDPSHEIRPGDILLSRANTEEYVGAPVLVRACRRRLLLSDKSLRLVPCDAVDPQWLAYLLSSPSVRRELSSRATGTKDSMRNISQDSLRQINVDLPPIAEQRRVVSALEQHLSRMDAGHSLILSARKKLAVLQKSIMSTAVGQAGRERDTWGWCLLGDVASIGTGSTPLRSKPEYYRDGTVPWVTSGLLNQPVVRQADQFVTDLALRESSLRLFSPGTILMAMYGEGKTRGKTAELAIHATVNQACAAISIKPEFGYLHSWIKLVLEARYSELRTMASGGVQPNLNLGIVKNIRIPLPPDDYRLATLGKMEVQREAVGRLESSLSRGITRYRSLRRSLLHLAFVGGLTPRDATEEPANELLARVLSQPATNSKHPRRRNERTAPVHSVLSTDFVQEEIPL